MALAASPSTCVSLQAFPVESTRRTTRAVSGNAAVSISFALGSSAFLGDRIQLGQGLKPSLASTGGKGINAQSTTAQFYNDGGQNGSLQTDDSSPAWNSDPAAKFSSYYPYAGHPSAVAGTADYALSQNELYGNHTGSPNYVSTPLQQTVGEDKILVDSKIAANDDGLAISALGINPEIVKALADKGISHLFPIQRAVFEPAMQGKDLIGRAKTGTGKTLAFGIPIVDRILQVRKQERKLTKGPSALVLAPTRELAKQVEKEFMTAAPSLSTVCVYGGVPIMSQQRLLSRGVDVAVGTPGRIIDLIERGSLDLKTVQYVVLDEADQMLAVGFEEDVEKIMEQLPQQRQNMLFSATMPAWVQRISKKYLNRPLTIDLVGESDEKLAEGIKMYGMLTTHSAKRAILNDVISVYARGGKTIVFTQTKRDAEDVSLAMSKSLGCGALHGDIAQLQREKTLNAFREGTFAVLVATDVASRGLDIPNVDLVIHYDLPNDPETFVHRSGRTGRAGKEGATILMYTDQQRRNVKVIEREVGCRFSDIGPPHVEDVLNASSLQAASLLQKVHPELKEVFLPVAEKILQQQGVGAFAAAIAHMSGYSQPPACRSLITHETGYMTLQFTRSPARGFGFSARNVLGAISDIYQSAADHLGKVYIIDSQTVDGAVFDLPEDVAKELLSKPTPPGDKVDIIKQLPRLEESLRSSSEGRESGGRGGRYRSSSAGRSSRYGASDGGYGGGSGRYGGSGGYGSSSGYSRSGSYEKSAGSYGGYERSSGGGSGSRSFAGTCFTCGQPGHRSTDCPNRR